MKHGVLTCLALLLAGCACVPQAPLKSSAATEAAAVAATPAAEAAKAAPPPTMRSLPARSGEMAFSAERVAKEAGCYRSESATLMAQRTGIQFYRVPCDSGRQVLVKCELRQCRMVD